MEAEISRKNRAVRLRLTDKCNFRCFFCHDEGGHSKDEYTPGADETLQLVDTLWAEGRRDFTLTGGEPLVNMSLVHALLDWFATKGDEVKVSLITNGELLKEDIIDKLSRCADKKIHISIHTADALKYQKITGQQRITPREIAQRVTLAASKGIDVKINAVLLKHINSDWEDIQSLMHFAAEAGAKYIKLIEFLVTDEKYYDMYVKADFISALLKKKLGAPVFSDKRTTTFRASDIGLFIETTKCTCGVGCESCAMLSSDIFTGAGFFHPCMLEPVKYDMSHRSLIECYSMGDSFVNMMAEKYGINSPSLIRYSEYVQGYKGVLFSVSERALLELAKDAEQLSLQKFKDSYMSLPSSAQSEYRAKIRHNEHESGIARLILYNERYEPKDGWDWYSIRFIDKEQEVFNASPSLMNKFLKAMGCMADFELHHERRMFKKDRLLYSLEKIEGIGFFVYFTEQEVLKNGKRILELMAKVKGISVKQPHLKK